MKTSTAIILVAAAGGAAWYFTRPTQSQPGSGILGQLGGLAKSIGNVVGQLTKPKTQTQAPGGQATTGDDSGQTANQSLGQDNGSAISDGMGVARTRSGYVPPEGYMTRQQLAQIGGISYSQFSTAVG